MDISQIGSAHQPDIWPMGSPMPVCSECSDYDRALFHEWPCDAARMTAEIKRLRGMVKKLCLGCSYPPDFSCDHEPLLEG
jgi:hypothetical protein